MLLRVVDDDGAVPLWGWEIDWEVTSLRVLQQAEELEAGVLQKGNKGSYKWEAAWSAACTPCDFSATHNGTTPLYCTSARRPALSLYPYSTTQ